MTDSPLLFGLSVFVIKEVILVVKLKYNCVFGGGGVRGLCYVGSVMALEEFDIELNSIAGSSVGAVFAMLYAVGYSAYEIKNFFMDFNFNMFKDININIFGGDISLSKGEIFLDWLREKAEKKFYGSKYEKGNNPPVRFKDIEKDLSVLTLDINTNTPYIFSKQNTPDEEIALAVRISAGMPGLMKPIKQNDNLLVDGDLIKTRPAFKIYTNLDNSDTRLLEFRLEGTRDGSELKNPSDYINSIISTIWYLSTEHIYDLYHKNDRYDFIIIDAKEVIMFDFTIDKTTRENMIDKGYNTTKHYLTNTLIEKKKIIIEIYKKLLNQIQLLQKEINKSSSKNAIKEVNEILSNMIDFTEYIDISIYEKIREIKDLLISNIQSTIISIERISNKSLVKEKTQFVEMLIKERIEDIENYIKNNCKKI